MKNIFKYFITIILTLFLSVSFSSNVYATETSNEFTALTVKANASDYDGDIAFTFTQDNGFNYNVLLTKAENYTATIDIVGDIEYGAKATLKKDSSKFKIEGLDNKYKVTGKNVEITFKVIKEEFKLAENTNDNNTTNNNTTNNTTNSNNLDRNDIYKKYIDEVSFIENNSDYETFLKLYTNDIMKDYFLKADSLNTLEDWDKMSDFEKWNYYILFVRPKTIIMANTVDNEDSFLKQLTSEELLLSEINDGDKVIEAVKSVWKWEWKQWSENGEFVNLYDEYTSGSAEKYSETELTDVDNEDNKEEVKEENGLVKGIKSNIISILILIAVGIATIIVIVLRRRKNYDNIDNE